MGEVIGTGTLVGVSQDSAEIWTPDKYTGFMGILFSGDFSTGFVTPKGQDPANRSGGFSRNHGFFDIRTGARRNFQYSAPGLYLFRVHHESFIFDLSSATAADIDWVLFAGMRP